MEKNKYPINDGIGSITNLNAVREVKVVNIVNIEEINTLIKKDWIFICMKSNQEMLLGRI